MWRYNASVNVQMADHIWNFVQGAVFQWLKSREWSVLLAMAVLWDEREVCSVLWAVYLSPLPARLCSLLFGHFVLFYSESSSYLFAVVGCHYWGSAAHLCSPVISLQPKDVDNCHVESRSLSLSLSCTHSTSANSIFSPARGKVEQFT